jgi:hypothetical protein
MFQRLERWTAELPFPEAPHPGLGYHDLSLPVHDALVRPPGLHPDTPRRLAELVLRGASGLVAKRPPHGPATRVIAYLPLDDLLEAGIDVIFDEAYWVGFMNRTTYEQTWTPLGAERSLAAEMGLAVPSGFREQGFHTHHRDDSNEPPQDDQQGETWVFYEVLPSDSPG